MTDEDYYKKLRGIKSLAELESAKEFHWRKKMMLRDVVKGNQHLPGVIKSCEEYLDYHLKCLDILSCNIHLKEYSNGYREV